MAPCILCNHTSQIAELLHLFYFFPIYCDVYCFFPSLTYLHDHYRILDGYSKKLCFYYWFFLFCLPSLSFFVCLLFLYLFAFSCFCSLPLRVFWMGRPIQLPFT